MKALQDVFPNIHLNVSKFSAPGSMHFSPLFLSSHLLLILLFAFFFSSYFILKLKVVFQRSTGVVRSTGEHSLMNMPKTTGLILSPQRIGMPSRARRY